MNGNNLINQSELEQKSSQSQGTEIAQSTNHKLNKNLANNKNENNLINQSELEQKSSQSQGTGIT